MHALDVFELRYVVLESRLTERVIDQSHSQDFAKRLWPECLARLGLGANPLMPISAETYSRAAYLGSFEYQTGGRRRRGEDHAGRPGGEHSGISTRKGVVGDWRSSFTPRAVERFKELTGNALVTLGYERDSHWQL